MYVSGLSFNNQLILEIGIPNERKIPKACSRFEALMNFLQGYIDNEINFNANATCASSCADYELTKHFSCADGTICANPNPGRDPNGLEKDDTICDGIIRECRDIGIEGDITVNFVKFTAGRYNYLYFNDGHRNRTYGLDPKYVRGINLTVRNRSLRCNQRNLLFEMHFSRQLRGIMTRMNAVCVLACVILKQNLIVISVCMMSSQTLLQISKSHAIVFF